MHDLEKYPNLKAMRQEQQVDIPAGYFSLLPELILSKIHENQDSTEIESEIPENYFEEFYEKIAKKIEMEKELTEMPLLTSLPKEREDVPFDYFEKMTETLIQKTQSNAGKIISPDFGQSKKASQWQNIRKAIIGIAACLVLATFYFFGSTENQQSAISFQKVSDEELIQAIENEDIDDNLLADELNIEVVGVKKEKSAIKAITDDEILKYLEEEVLEEL